MLIFVQNKERAEQVFNELIYEGLNIDVIHSDRTQMQRNRTVQKFRSGEIWILITTDLMSRGMDFKGVNLVINFDFPQSATTYIHRVGRTGRAGRQGEAITFYTEDDLKYLKLIANVMRSSGCNDIPQWIFNSLKTPTKDQKKMLVFRPPERAPVSKVTNKKKRVNAKKEKQQNKQPSQQQHEIVAEQNEESEEDQQQTNEHQKQPQNNGQIENPKRKKKQPVGGEAKQKKKQPVGGEAKQKKKQSVGGEAKQKKKA